MMKLEFSIYRYNPDVDNARVCRTTPWKAKKGVT